MGSAAADHAKKFIDLTNNCSRTPLHWAAACGRSANCEFLVANGADLTLRDSDGMTPRELAAFQYHSECAERLDELAEEMFGSTE